MKTVATSKRGDCLSAQEPVQMTEATRKRGDYRRHMTEEHAANAAVVPFSTQTEATPIRAFPSPELTSSWGKASENPTQSQVPTMSQRGCLSRGQDKPLTEATRSKGDYRRHMTGEHAANAAVLSTQMEATPMRAFPSPELTSSWGKSQRSRHRVEYRRHLSVEARREDSGN